MARIVPLNPGTHLSRLHPEYLAMEQLARLSKDWTIYWSTDVLNHNLQGEIDFLLVHPDFGIIVLEVKGGRIQTRLRKSKNPNRPIVCFERINRNRTVKPIKDPFKQARQQAHDFVLPKLKDLNLQNPVLVSYGVWFPGGDLPANDPLPPHVARAIIVPSAALTDLPTLETAMVSIRDFWKNHRQMRSLGHVFPLADHDVSAIHRWLTMDGVLIQSLIDPYTVGAILREQLRLTDEQSRYYLDWVDHKRAVVTGYAGTGKTILATARARHCADGGERVLAITLDQALVEKMALNLGGVEPPPEHSPLWTINQGKGSIDVCTPRSLAIHVVDRILEHTCEMSNLRTQLFRGEQDGHIGPNATEVGMVEFLYQLVELGLLNADEEGGIDAWLHSLDSELGFLLYTSNGLEDTAVVGSTVLVDLLSRLGVSNDDSFDAGYSSLLYDAIVCDEAQAMPKELLDVLPLLGHGDATIHLFGDPWQSRLRKWEPPAGYGKRLELKVNCRSAVEIVETAAAAIDQASSVSSVGISNGRVIGRLLPLRAESYEEDDKGLTEPDWRLVRDLIDLQIRDLFEVHGVPPESLTVVCDWGVWLAELPTDPVPGDRELNKSHLRVSWNDAAGLSQSSLVPIYESHSFIGHESDVVLLLLLSPWFREKDDQEHSERLFYVAASRAVAGLVVLAFQHPRWESIAAGIPITWEDWPLEVPAGPENPYLEME